MKFDSPGIRFEYPDNWTLDQDEALAGDHSITVYSPEGGAFWSVCLHPRSAKPQDLAKAAAEAMKEEYDSLESEWVEETVLGQGLVGYDLNFYCFDLTSSAMVRSLRTPHGTYTFFWQAEDRDLDRFQAVFRAMMVSLLRGLGELPEGGPAEV